MLNFIHKAYKTCISPFLGTRCRFYPSCSSYSRQAFAQHTFLKAMYLSGKRILSCHPFHPGGIDELVPPIKAKRIKFKNQLQQTKHLKKAS